MKLGEAMYKAQAGAAGAAESPGDDGAGGTKPDDNVVDAEFSEVRRQEEGRGLSLRRRKSELG